LPTQILVLLTRREFVSMRNRLLRARLSFEAAFVLMFPCAVRVHTRSNRR
jgi:hypothetical protein